MKFGSYRAKLPPTGPLAAAGSSQSASWWNWKKLLIPGLAALILVAAGSAVGHFGAGQLARQQTVTGLKAGAERVSSRLDEIIGEAAGTFEALHALQLPTCGEAELLAMRTQLFNARFIRDIGRIEKSSLICSSALGILDPPYQSGRPDLRIHRGLGLRTDREILVADRKRSMVIESGRYNAVVDPAIVTDLTSAVSTAEVFLRPLGGESPSTDWHPFRQGVEISSRGLSGETCSSRSGLCIKLHQTLPVAADNHQPTRIAMSGLGGAVGLAVFFAMVASLRHNDTPEQQLRLAIRQRNIRANYQPIIRLPNQELIGFEALARWYDADGRQIPAEEFIELAEQSGLIGEISTLMMEQIGQELSGWLVQNPDKVIAINIAPAELADPDLLTKIDRELLNRGVRPEQIVLEVTERTMVADESVSQRIEVLAGRGFKIYADDFGIGYCGLAYLNDMDVHGVKISHLFTAAVATDSPKAALVPRITQLARELGLDVIIEGVETEAQVEAMSELIPIAVQGWLYSSDFSAEELIKRYG